MRRRGRTVGDARGAPQVFLSRTGQLGLLILLVVFCVFVFLRVR